MFALTAPAYLDILKTAAPDDHPFIEVEDSEEVGAAFANMAIAVAAFVEACQANEGVGYKEARDTLEAMVHTFPTDDKASSLDIMLAALSKALTAPADEAKEG